MENYKTQAQQECTPTLVEKATQHKRILDTIARQGFITNWGAIHDVRLHCTKLSTRIGEIECKCGHRFVHERVYAQDAQGRNRLVGTKYTIPAGLTINDFRI